MLGDRDINEHDYDWIKWDASSAKSLGRKPSAPAKELVKIVTDKMVPFQGDLDMLDFSENNIYSEHMAKLVSWHRYYTRFWKQSMLFCDTRWPDFVNIYSPDNIGSTGIAESKYVKAVSGKDFSFLDGINLGRKIWNLDHAIWTLQGRHRDMVHFAGQVYDVEIYFVVDRGGDECATHVMRTRYYAVDTDTLLALMERAGYVDVQRLDGVYFQPLLVGTRP